MSAFLRLLAQEKLWLALAFEGKQNCLRGGAEMRRGSNDQAFPADGCARDAMMSFDAAGQATALMMIAKRAGGYAYRACLRLFAQRKSGAVNSAPLFRSPEFMRF